MLKVLESSTFSTWVRELEESPRARILSRLRRLELGNLGDWKAVGNGVNELRIDFGPGYRVYFARQGKTVVVLLAGGEKATQAADIRRAKSIWRDFKKG
jgi:putative addiction module killer protein